MEMPWRWTLILLLISSTVHQAYAECFPAIFYFGDDDGDTGGIHAAFPNVTPAESPPYGRTYFKTPTGRNSDGRLIVDFIAAAFGLPFLAPYMQSVFSDFSQGVTFATWGATAQTVNFLSFVNIGWQVKQFQLFQSEVSQILNTTAVLLASKGLLETPQAVEPGVNPYKKLYSDLFINTTLATLTTNNCTPVLPDFPCDATNATQSDQILRKALANAKRLPLTEYFAQGLYMVSVGTNDFRWGILANNTPNEIEAYLPNVVAEVTAAIENLYNAGARNIIVSGVGNIGCWPALLTVISFTFEDLDNWGCLAAYNTLARSYNDLLIAGLNNLTTTFPAASIIYLDNYQIQHNILFNYTSNGFVGDIKACCGVPSTYNYNPEVLCGETGNVANNLLVSQTCASPATYVDWDGIHYTDAANGYFAEQIFSGQYFSPSFTLQRDNCTLKPI